MGEGGWFVPISHTNLPFNHHNDFHAKQMCVFFVFIVKRYRTQTLKARDPDALGVMVLVLVYAESRHFEVTKRERRLFQSNWFDWKPKNDSSHAQTIPWCWCVCVCVRLGVCVGFVFVYGSVGHSHDSKRGRGREQPW